MRQPIFHEHSRGGGTSRGSLDLVSALLLLSAALFLSFGTDIDGICLFLSGLLTLEVNVSRVVTVCFSVRRSRSSPGRIVFVRGFPDSVLLCVGRSGPEAGEFAPEFCVRDSKEDALVVFSRVLTRGARLSPAPAAFFCLLLSALDCLALWDIAVVGSRSVWRP